LASGIAHGMNGIPTNLLRYADISRQNRTLTGNIETEGKGSPAMRKSNNIARCTNKRVDLTIATGASRKQYHSRLLTSLK